MLNLLVDTSVWLDLAKRRDGQKLIHVLGQASLDGDVGILVPEIVLDEFLRNRERIERSMTSSVADRFRLLERDLDSLSAEWHRPGFDAIKALAYEMPLIGAMATRNFRDILALLEGGQHLEISEVERDRVIRRGLAKRAPFHRNKNSTADAMLIELYASLLTRVDEGVQYGFITSNSDDFSQDKGDPRFPHADISECFTEPHSAYYYGVDGLYLSLSRYYGEEFNELLEMSDFQEDPRTLEEIQEAESEFFDRCWFDFSTGLTSRYESGDQSVSEHSYHVSVEAQQRALERRPDLRRAESAFEWGMWNGKLSTLRWVLGSEWDFLDT